MADKVQAGDAARGATGGGREAVRPSSERRRSIAGNEHVVGAEGGDMSYVIDEAPGHTVLDVSAFLGWDSSGSESSSSRTSEITIWSIQVIH